MTWLAVAAGYALLVAVYCLGHELGYRKARSEASAILRLYVQRREVPGAAPMLHRDGHRGNGGGG